MRNRSFFRLVTWLGIVLLCVFAFSSCGQDEEEETLGVSPTVQNVAESIRFERMQKYDEEQDLYLEYATIMGMTSEEEVLWTHITDRYPCGQYYRVEEVFFANDRYVYAEGGSLMALDTATGIVLWKNSDIGGCSISCVEGEDGELYFCAYQGTAFLTVDRCGNTIYKIESFGKGYDWAYDIRLEDDIAIVTMELGPGEPQGPEGYVIAVDLSNYTFELYDSAENLVPDTVCLPALAGDIAQVLPMEHGAVAVLYTDGTVGIAGNEELARMVSAWKNVVQLYLGTEEGTLAARRADGTAVSTEYDLSGWHDVKKLYVCWQGIAGLMESGAIVAVGPWEYSNPDGWLEIRDFWISDGDCFGLKEDGTIICEEQSYFEEVLSWENVQQLYFTPDIFAILEDGSIAANYDDDYNYTLDNLQGAVKFIKNGWPFALSADGRLLAVTAEDDWVYNNGDYFTTGECEYIDAYPNIYIHDIRFQNIKDICEHHALLMLKYDGTVDTVNIDHYWDLSEWKDIETIITTHTYNHEWGDVPRIYGVRKDGSVIVAESEYSDESITMDNYLGWRVVQLFKGENERYGLESVVGITPEGTLVGDGYYAETDFSVLAR